MNLLMVYSEKFFDRQKWLHEANRLLQQDWSIDLHGAGFSNQDALAHAAEGETPEHFVAWIAEKYDLIKF